MKAAVLFVVDAVKYISLKQKKFRNETSSIVFR